MVLVKVKDCVSWWVLRIWYYPLFGFILFLNPLLLIIIVVIIFWCEKRMICQGLMNYNTFNESWRVRIHLKLFIKSPPSKQEEDHLQSQRKQEHITPWLPPSVHSNQPYQSEKKRGQDFISVTQMTICFISSKIFFSTELRQLHYLFGFIRFRLMWALGNGTYGECDNYLVICVVCRFMRIPGVLLWETWTDLN